MAESLSSVVTGPGSLLASLLCHPLLAPEVRLSSARCINLRPALKSFSLSLSLALALALALALSLPGSRAKGDRQEGQK